MSDLQLDSIVENSTEPTPEDKKKVQEVVDKALDSTIRRYEETTDLRSLLAKVFTFIIGFWLLGVLLLLAGNNFNYRLSDTVLITLLTTTTIQVLGMMIIILWDLFPGGKDKNNPNGNKTNNNLKAKPKIIKKKNTSPA